MKDILIVGSGGFAKEVGFLIDGINKNNPEWNILGFVDSNVGENNGKYKIVHDDAWLLGLDGEIHVVISVGVPELRKRLADKFMTNVKIKYPNLIHPNSVGDWSNSKMGKGNIVCAGNQFTTDIEIGNFNVFNLSGTVGHDTRIGDFNVINPSVNISGGIEMGNEILVGTGAQILQYITIESGSIIGAGAVVTKNITEKGVYAGIPARRIK